MRNMPPKVNIFATHYCLLCTLAQQLLVS